MIIDSIESISLFDTDVVKLWPCTKNRAEGVLEVCDHAYRVIVTVTEKQSRVWARVIISEPHKLSVNPEGVAIFVAEKALHDDSWRNVAVDIHDGEISLVTTLTVDMTATAINRFLAYSKEWLSKYSGDIDGLRSPRDIVESKQLDNQLGDEDVGSLGDLSLADFESLV